MAEVCHKTEPIIVSHIRHWNICICLLSMWGWQYYINTGLEGPCDARWSISDHSRYNQIIGTAYLSILSCTGHPVLLYHISKRFWSTSQRNKLLEKSRIVHKVLKLNLIISIHVPCCAFFKKKKKKEKKNRHMCQQDGSTMQSPAYLAKTINTSSFCSLKIKKLNCTHIHYYRRLSYFFLQFIEPLSSCTVHCPFEIAAPLFHSEGCKILANNWVTSSARSGRELRFKTIP